MLISIVIPVYNSTVLEELVERIEAVFAERPEDYEIILVDDYSPNPDTWHKLALLASRHPAVKAVQLTRNFGQHAATLCGLRLSNGDFVITMDDDLEHRPEEIPRFLALADHDIVIAQFKNRHHNLYKRLTSRIKSLFDRIIIGQPAHIRFSSYRMLSRVVVEGMLSIHTPHPFIPALIFHVSKDAIGLEIEHQRRLQGQSGYTFYKLFRLFTDLVIHNSSLMLRLVGQVGIVFAAISFLLALLVVYKKLVHGISITGWSSLFATLLLIGGLLLFSLGIVGEYLIRIIESSEAKPTYFVRRRAGFHPPNDSQYPKSEPRSRVSVRRPI